MLMTCRNICERTGRTMRQMFSEFHEERCYKKVDFYTLGFRYCARCARWFKMEQLKKCLCPCCSNKVRAKSRASWLRQRRKVVRVE